MKRLWKSRPQEEAPTEAIPAQPVDVLAVLQRYGIPEFVYHTWPQTRRYVSRTRPQGAPGAPGLATAPVTSTAPASIPGGRPPVSTPAPQETVMASTASIKTAAALKTAAGKPAPAAPTVTPVWVDSSPTSAASSSGAGMNGASRPAAGHRESSSPGGRRESSPSPSAPSAPPVPPRAESVPVAVRAHSTVTIPWDEPDDLSDGPLPLLAHISDAARLVAQLSRTPLVVAAGDEEDWHEDLETLPPVPRYEGRGARGTGKNTGPHAGLLDRIDTALHNASAALASAEGLVPSRRGGSFAEVKPMAAGRHDAALVNGAARTGHLARLEDAVEEAKPADRSAGRAAGRGEASERREAVRPAAERRDAAQTAPDPRDAVPATQETARSARDQLRQLLLKGARK